MTTEQMDWLDDERAGRHKETPAAMDHHDIDALRELAKVEATLEAAEAHLTKQNEANAALHMSERVLYSPLTVAVINARESAKKIREALGGTTPGEQR
jgi:nucleoside diphosphate kinase